jgi:hypothetical protein
MTHEHREPGAVVDCGSLGPTATVVGLDDPTWIAIPAPAPSRPWPQPQPRPRSSGRGR